MFGTIIGFSKRDFGPPMSGTEYDIVDVHLDNGAVEDYLLLNFQWTDIEKLRIGDRVTILLSREAFAVECYRGEVYRDYVAPQDPPVEHRVDWIKEGW